MGHIYVAKKLNYRVGSICIDLFHGSAEVGHVSNHKDNILIVAAGPIVNLILMLISFGLKSVLPAGILYDFMDSMANVNGVLFIFNILPIFPMDGGRISKSVLSLIFGNLKGMFYNGILSMVSSILLFIASMYCGMPVLAIFSLLFAYFSYKEIEASR
jgi:stage IV sporulation protein FB